MMPVGEWDVWPPLFTSTEWLRLLFTVASVEADEDTAAAAAATEAAAWRP
jgi:hypothetical protein